MNKKLINELAYDLMKYIHSGTIDFVRYDGIINILEKHLTKGEKIEIKKELDKLSNYEREEIFANYCTHCGDKDPTCQCWNDD